MTSPFANQPKETTGAIQVLRVPSGPEYRNILTKSQGCFGVQRLTSGFSGTDLLTFDLLLEQLKALARKSLLEFLLEFLLKVLIGEFADGIEARFWIASEQGFASRL